MMSHRTRLYLAFTAVALLALSDGGIHLWGSAHFREVEEQADREERIVLLGHELLAANLILHSLVQDCIDNYRPACKTDYDTALVQRGRVLDELVRSEDLASALQELEVLRAQIDLIADVETQVLARSARGDSHEARKLFDRGYSALQVGIQRRIRSFQAVEAQEAISARTEVQNQTRILDMFTWVATGTTLLLVAFFVLYLGRALARPVAALAASEARYSSLFESSRDALVTLAPPSWMFSGANQAALQLFGASSVAELTVLGPADVSPERQPDGRLSREKAQEMIATALREGSHFFEWECRRLNGELFAVDALLTRMQEGENAYLQVTVRDISKRKKRGAEWRLFRKLLDQSIDGVYVTDPVSARFLDVNDAVCRELGYTRAELLTMTVFDVTVGFDRTMFEAAIGQGKTQGHTTVLATVRRKDSSTYPVEVRVSYVSLDRDYLLAIVHDISARVHAEAEKDQLVKRLDDLATRDQLTGAWNRRRFDEALAVGMAHARRYGQPLSLIMFDIDHFKNVNDTHGHLAGDDLLAALATYVSANIRDTDMLARWGGEEFMLIAPGIDEEGAVRQAEKLRALIEHGNFGAVGQITCSFGVTQFRAGDKPDDFTGRADTAMYVAKQTGRNRVVRYEDSMKAAGASG